MAQEVRLSLAGSAASSGPVSAGTSSVDPVRPLASVTARPRPLPVTAAVSVARLLARTHRRPPRLPWHPSATATVGFLATIAGAAYGTPSGDAVAIVWRCTPGGVLVGGARVGAALAAGPAVVGLVSRSWLAAATVAMLEGTALVALDVVYEVSSRRARARWLERPGHHRPPRSDRVALLRRNHLVGLGVGAETQHAADAICRSIAHHADLPIYTVASTPAHARLFRRFGFEPVGPSWYGETPMVRPPGPIT